MWMQEPARVHYSALPDYHSYDLAWLGPIAFPLYLALLVQAFVVKDMMSRRSSKPSVDVRTGATHSAHIPVHSVQSEIATLHVPQVTTALILAAETIFGVLCIIQCVHNYSSRAFVGGAGPCDTQALYSTYYIFAGMGLATFGIAVGCYIRVHGDASMKFVVSTGVAVHALALVLASLPHFGLGAYLFAVDFCVADIEQPLFAALTIGVYALCLLVILGSLAYERRHRAAAASPPGALYVAAAWFAVAWLSVVHISLLWLVGGTSVYDSDRKTAYAWMGMLTHSNQLVVPICFGFFWRRAPLALKPAAEGDSLKASMLNVA